MPARKITLGGSFIESKTDNPLFEQTYKDLGYIWVDVPGKGQLQIFINFATGLLVADMVGKDCGTEFIRTILPKAPRLTKKERELAAQWTAEEEEWAAGD